MYYLNAFNEMLKKRQRQNMMGGEGNDYGVGTTAPSGPMGLGPAQDRSGLRDFYNNMSPGARFGLGMIPGVGKALSIGNLANYAMSQYNKFQLAPADAAMASARQGFQASEKSGYATPDYGYVDDSGDRLGFSGPTVGGPMEQPSITGTALAPMAPEEAVSSPVSQSSVTGTALDTFGGGFGGSPAGFGGGFGGGVGTGEFGGSPESASDLGYNQGGMVTPDRLMGRAPAPDDGYGALQGGEYVITKAAVEKYGKRMMDAINNGTFR
jgi:hypothetical protein